MKFLHTADLHIDSPLQSLEAYEGAPQEQMRSVTREAFANVVSLALDQEVDFVLIAGDLFDGEWKCMQTGLWANQQFRRLQQADIPVYTIRGNHDADSEITRRLTTPENVYEFPVEQASTRIDEQLGVALHGHGFPTRSVEYDLSAGYPPAVEGLFNIGLLHTSLAGNPQHDTYAPTSVEQLSRRGYDYWALGHVHAHQIIGRAPWIVYPGNVQGRHFRECGSKGCVIVSVTDSHECDVQFHETDVIRWHIVPLELTEEQDRDDACELLRARLIDRLDASGGRPIVCRVSVSGACRLHRQLQDHGDQQRVKAEFQNVANDIGDCWLGQIRFETRPLVDIRALRNSNTLLGELLQDVEQLVTGPADDLKALTRTFDALQTRATSGPSDLLRSAGVNLDDADQIRRWLRTAEGHIVSLLQEHAPQDQDAEFSSEEVHA